MKQINLNRQLLGVEDFLFGIGTVIQTRGGQQVEVTKVNAGNLPFDETKTLLEWAQNTNLEAIILAIPEITAVYGNLNELLTLDETATELTEQLNRYLGMSVTITTLDPGTQAQVEYNSLTGVLHFSIPSGLQGDTGVSITSVARTSGTGLPGTTDTYTISYSNSTTSTFQVYNGADGYDDTALSDRVTALETALGNIDLALDTINGEVI